MPKRDSIADVHCLEELLGDYDVTTPLEKASTIPSEWYTDPRVYELECRQVFARSWQFVGRADQLVEPGQFVTADVAGEPIIVVRAQDGVLKAFFNVCRHHAAQVEPRACGRASRFRCPYHGWSYDLDGTLTAVPEFDSVADFDQSKNGLCPVRVDTWEQFVFVCLDDGVPSLGVFLGELASQVSELGLGQLSFAQRRSYELQCNWKVFVDNYLDGGYHVPHIHKGLSSVINYQEYRIDCGDRYCVQSSPLDPSSGDQAVAEVRKGEHAHYSWLYPNFMLNWYEGYADVNIVVPLDVDRCLVIFDFYFAGDGDGQDARHEQSITIAEKVQQEDVDICESVQRGLKSRAYDVGRLSVRREAGEHLFHRLLAIQLRDMHG